MYRSILKWAILALISGAKALTFTLPETGAAIDPLRDIVIEWTSDSSDPQTIDLIFDNEFPNEMSTELTLASDFDISAGTFTIPANIIQNWGTRYQIKALDDGDTVAQVTDLSLAPFAGQVSTDSAGRLTIVSQTSTAQGPITAPTLLQSATGFTLLSGTATPEPTVGSVRSSGFVTSSTSRSSIEASATASTATNTNTANGQIQIRGSELVLGAAGVLAGIVALLA